MEKTLHIANTKNAKFMLNYKLNSLTVSIHIKESEFWEKVFTKDYIITNNFNLEEILEEFYTEYAELKNIEYVWNDNLKNMDVIELNFDD